MTQRHISVERPGGPIDGYGYGFGLLRIGGHDSFGHNGGTIGASCQLDMLWMPDLTIIVLTNLDGAQRQASSLMRRALLSDD